MSVGIWGCSKENTFRDIGDTSEIKPTPTIKIEDAKSWFDDQKAKLGNISNLGEDSTLLLPHAKPNWEKAFNDFSNNGLEYVVSPLKEAFLLDEKSDTRLLIRKNKDGKLEGFYMTYLADSVYHKQTDGKYKPETYTGAVIVSNLSGKFEYGYAIKNGKIGGTSKAVKKQNLQGNNGNNTLGTRSLECRTISVAFEVPIVLAATNYEYVNIQICYETNPGGGFSTGTNPYGGGGGAGDVMIQNYNWSSYQPSYLFDNNFENSALKTYLTSKGFGSSSDLNFFATNQQAANYVKSYLGNNPSAEKKRLARVLVEMMKANPLYKEWFFLTGQGVAEVANLDKYKSGGFKDVEYTLIRIDPSLFAQVDGFLKRLNFNSSAVNYVKRINKTNSNSQVLKVQNGSTDQTCDLNSSSLVSFNGNGGLSLAQSNHAAVCFKLDELSTPHFKTGITLASFDNFVYDLKTLGGQVIQPGSGSSDAVMLSFKATLLDQNSGTVLKEYNGTNIQQDQQAALSMGNIGNNYAPIDQKPEAFYDANQLRAFNAYAVTFNDGQKHVFLEISIVARKPQ